MIRDTRFWVSVAIFQAVFGLAVFALTRSYYLSHPADPGPGGKPLLESSLRWPGPVAGPGPAATGSSTPPQLMSTDPAEISRQADEFFSAQNYPGAVTLYQQLLKLDPNNVEIHNNLGITLHYLGRSAEALQELKAGLALNPTHQRTWLTIGFVNSQLGNTEEARTALTNASQMGPNEEIRQSARTMLEALPPRQ